MAAPVPGERSQVTIFEPHDICSSRTGQYQPLWLKIYCASGWLSVQSIKGAKPFFQHLQPTCNCTHTLAGCNPAIEHLHHIFTVPLNCRKNRIAGTHAYAQPGTAELGAAHRDP